MKTSLTDGGFARDERCPCSGDEGYNCALPGFHCSMMNIVNKMAAIQSKSQNGKCSS